MKNLFRLSPLILLFSIISLFFLSFPAFAAQPKAAEVFYSQACSDCGPYLERNLIPTLKEFGIEVEVKDYINGPQFRPQLSQRIEDQKIPQEMVGHMMTFITLSANGQEQTVVLAGHVPSSIISDLLKISPDKNWQPLVLWQDQMHGQAKSYRLWVAEGEVKNYPIDTPLEQALSQYQWGKIPGGANKSLLSAVLVSGFLDGLNPCAFAILLFLIAFVFMLKKSRLSVWKYGLVYTAAIYVTYLLIGLGLWKAILITSVPHLMAKVGSVLVIVLGGVNLINYFFPKVPISLRIPMPGRQKILELMHKGTLPTTLLLGILVGLCTFPCSGGIYVAIVALLAAKTTFTPGLFYLLVYNLMFILPLIIILALAGNRVAVEKMNNLEEKNEPRMRLIYGLTMIAIGVVILLYFV